MPLDFGNQLFDHRSGSNALDAQDLLWVIEKRELNPFKAIRGPTRAYRSISPVSGEHFHSLGRTAAFTFAGESGLRFHSSASKRTDADKSQSTFEKRQGKPSSFLVSLPRKIGSAARA
jgi:hypothetical protein